MPGRPSGRRRRCPLGPGFTTPDLRGRTAVVTGAGRGIGAAVASALAEAGARVVLVGRTEAALREAARRLAGASVYVADCADQDAMDRLAAGLSRCDILVNNAAILGPLGSLGDCSRAAFDDVLRINVGGTFGPIRALLPLLRRATPEGVIINLSSGVGRVPRAGWGPYATSKFAIEGLTGCLAADLQGSGVRCLAINPGGTRTPMRAAAVPGEDPGSLPAPEQVARAFLFALSPEAARMGLSGVSLEARDYFGPA